MIFMIPIIDVVLILVLFSFVFYGFFFGLIRTIGSLLSWILGFWIAGHFYIHLYGLIQSWFLGYDTFGKTFSYLLLFMLANRLIMLGVSLIETTYNIISIIPFLKTFNRLGGGLLGFLEGSIVVAVALNFIVRHADLPIIGKWALDLLVVSELTPLFLRLSLIINPFLPVIVNTVKSVM